MKQRDGEMTIESKMDHDVSFTMSFPSQGKAPACKENR